MEKTKYENYRFWTNFYGMVLFVGGIIVCISIIGALIGVPAILAGNKLRESAGKMKVLIQTEGSNEVSVEGEALFQRFFGELGVYFKVAGIVAIVSMFMTGIISGMTTMLTLLARY